LCLNLRKVFTKTSHIFWRFGAKVQGPGLSDATGNKVIRSLFISKLARYLNKEVNLSVFISQGLQLLSLTLLDKSCA
jgi:hypothetical protein